MDEVVGVDDNVPDPEEVKAAKEVKAAEERVAEADAESTTDTAGSNEVKSGATDLRAELQEQLARLACLDPLAVTPIIS